MPDILLANIVVADQQEKRILKTTAEVEREIWDMIRKLIADFESKGGKLSNSESSKKLLATLNTRLRKIIDNSGFDDGISGFLDNFDLIEENLKAVHQTLNDVTISQSTLTEQKQWAIENTIFSMKKANVDLKFMDPIKKLLYSKINFGASVVETEQQLRSIVIGDEKKFGILRRWVGQVARDSINQYEGVVNQEIKVKYGMNGTKYVGPIIEDSRPQCVRWVNMDVIPDSMLADEIAWAIKNGRGLIDGTDPSNFCVNRGGYNCIHSAYPTFV